MRDHPDVPYPSPPSSTILDEPNIASAKGPLFNLGSSFPPNTNAASGFMSPQSQFPSPPGLRSPSDSQSPFQFANSNAKANDREPINPIGTPFASSPAPMVRVMVRRLPLTFDEDALYLMMAWYKEPFDLEMLPVEQSKDEGSRSALLKFKSMTGAQEVKSRLDNHPVGETKLAFEILNTSPKAGMRYAMEQAISTQPLTSTNTASTVNGSAAGTRQPTRFNYQNMERISANQPNASLANSEALFNGVFPPQSPIGIHYADLPRASGKALIVNNSTDDDETRDLLKETVAYADHAPSGARRATAPQLGIEHMMHSLSLNTGNTALPASMPSHYSHNIVAQASPLTPVNGPTTGANYPISSQHIQRNNLPAVNPADQNPPCNTLYVGNLPLDTSEEELKGIFCKQRGYKRLCFRMKVGGPMCFVEFEDISFATKALQTLYGHMLSNSTKGGIRLSFSKNPLGVRSGQTTGPNTSPAAPNMSLMPGSVNGYAAASGPPPGLAAPPGLGPTRINQYSQGNNMPIMYSQGTNGPIPYPPNINGSHGISHPWNSHGLTNGANGVWRKRTTHMPPPHMTG